MCARGPVQGPKVVRNTDEQDLWAPRTVFLDPGCAGGKTRNDGLTRLNGVRFEFWLTSLLIYAYISVDLYL
jgi:hypothetical protein